MPTNRSLTHTVVIVTGATSGIGRETVAKLVSHGANVTATGRRQDRLDKLVEKYGPNRVHAVRADVRSAEDNREIVRLAAERWGQIDSVVINAGIGHYGGILDGSDDDMIEMLETNLHSTVWAIRAVTPHLLDRGGDIVVISSVAGLRGGGNEAVYASTKFGQVGLAGAVDRELRERGVRVTTICPAAVATEFAIGTGRSEDMPQMVDWLQPEDIASAIVYTLEQPRRLRTTQWVMWSASEPS